MPKKAEVAQNQPVAKKPRKPYPTHEERVAAADQTIARLTALNAAREARIAQAEADLEARRAALEKSQAALEKAKAQERASSCAPESSAQASQGQADGRRARPPTDGRGLQGPRREKAEKEKYDQLLAALAESGKTVEEVLEALKP